MVAADSGTGRDARRQGECPVQPPAPRPAGILARIGGDRLAAALFLAALATFADVMRETSGELVYPTHLLHLAWHLCCFLVFLVIGERAFAWLSRDTEDRDGARLEMEMGSCRPASARSPLFALHPRLTVGSIAKYAGFIYACWLPYLALSWPGVIWYDSRQQILQFFGLPNVFSSGQLVDHHPVFDTVLYGGAVRIGQLMGSADAGVYLFCLLQALVCAVALAICLAYARRIGATRRAMVLALGALCVNPLVPAYASAMAKDATFLPWFLLFSVIVLETVRTRGRALERPRNLVLAVCLAMLMALTRKTGLIMALVICAAAFPQVKGHARRARLGIVAGVPALLMLAVMPAFVLPAIGAKPGGKQEALGIMFQQSAALVRAEGDALPAAQRDAITATLGDDVGNRYAWWITDSVKGPTWDARKDPLLNDYLRAWAQGLVQHPLIYLKTYLAIQIGWFSVPNAADGEAVRFLTPIDAHEMDHTFAGSAQLGLTWSDNAAGSAWERAVSWLQGTPAGAILFSKGSWSTWPLALLAILRRRGRGQGGVLPLLTAANLVLWIAPTSTTREAMRYLLPLFFLLPVALAWLTARGPDER